MSIDFSQPAATSIRVTPNAGQATGEVTQKAEAKQGWGGDGFGLDDFIDLINPLQHIPVVGDIYRELTGDKIAEEARLITSMAVGGPTGFIATVANLAFEKETGDSIAGHVLTAFGLGDDEAATQTASTTTPAAPAAASVLASAGEPRGLMPTDLPEPPRFASATESLPPLDFGSSDSQKAPVSLPPSLPEEDAILSLFAPELVRAREEYQQSQSILLAQEVARELDS